MTILQQSVRDVDAVFVDKDECLLEAFAVCAADLNKEVDTYQAPQHFLDNIHHYSKQTRIVLGVSATFFL